MKQVLLLALLGYLRPILKPLTTNTQNIISCGLLHVSLCLFSLSNNHKSHFVDVFLLLLIWTAFILVLSRVGANVQFSCEDNYVLQGAKGITCQRVTETLAAWSDHRPICRGKVSSRWPRLSLGQDVLLNTG